MTKTRWKPLAAASLGALLMLGLPPAWAGPEEDFVEGSKTYFNGDLIGSMPKLRQAADAGHAGAQAMFGNILEQADDRREAVKYYRKSAEQGNADGQFGYAALLGSGDGVDKNIPEARRWLEAAARQGHKMAINELALAYMRGRLEISEDERKSATALEWVKLSAENGFLPAMDAMVLAHRNGEFGLPADAKAAARWTEKIDKIRGVRKTGRRNRSKE
jgi:TPR repeat protein